MLLKDILLKVLGMNVVIKDMYGDILFDTRIQDFDANILFIMEEYKDKEIMGIDAELLEGQTAFLVFYVN